MMSLRLLPTVMLVAALGVVSVSAAGCQFCTTTSTDTLTWDLSSLPSGTFTVNDAARGGLTYRVTSPCGVASPEFGDCGCSVETPAVQRGCYTLGRLGNETVVMGDARGLNVSLNNPEPGARSCDGRARTSTYVFKCDPNAPVDNPPTIVLESPGCHYNVEWTHPAACPVTKAGSSCSTPHPTPGPAPPVSDAGCAPTWKPTWDMKSSTILYACNETGFHDVQKAIQYGVVVYDWSNAKAIWAQGQPMNSEELLTKQAEMVIAADPGLGPGYQQRVWVYRNTIKALNWYTSVREKLDDPAYEGWFIRFKDCQGNGASQNNSGIWHVPVCTYEKCSCFYHDQEQTPEYPKGDGTCLEECDCGKQPCGEYIFDHRNSSFGDWFINEYMITNETLYHDPPIGLGWLDDSMRLSGPTEEDKHFINDTGSSPQDMQDMVNAYQADMLKFHKTVIEKGGFSWQQIRGPTPGVMPLTSAQADECASKLRQWCRPESAMGSAASLYKVDPTYVTDPTNATDYTSEFLLTRGPYAWLGYSWAGCGGTDWPRPSIWDADLGGEPSGMCTETAPNSRIFTRSYPNAAITWDCNTGHGDIKM